MYINQHSSLACRYTSQQIFKPGIIDDQQEYSKIFNCISQWFEWSLWVAVQWHKAYTNERKGYKLSVMIVICKDIGLILCLNDEYDLCTPYYLHRCSTYAV